MTNEQVIDAVLQWVAAELPVVGASTYDYVPAGKSKELPDCVGALEFERIVRDDARFPITQLQQIVALRVFEMELSLMVQTGTTEAEHAAAAAELRGLVEQLVVAVCNDHTLGGRVFAASAEVEADYRRPFVKWEDGTRGREVLVSLAVAEPLTPAGD